MSSIRAVNLLAIATWALTAVVPAAAAPGDYVGVQPPATGVPAVPAAPPDAGVTPPGASPYAGIPPGSSPYAGLAAAGGPSFVSSTAARPSGAAGAPAVRSTRVDDGEEAASSGIPVTPGDAAGLAAVAALSAGVVFTLRRRA